MSFLWSVSDSADDGCLTKVDSQRQDHQALLALRTALPARTGLVVVVVVDQLESGRLVEVLHVRHNFHHGL